MYNPKRCKRCGADALKKCLAMTTGFYLIHMNAALSFRDFQPAAGWPHPVREGVAGKAFFIAPSPHQDSFATGG